MVFLGCVAGVLVLLCVVLGVTGVLAVLLGRVLGCMGLGMLGWMGAVMLFLGGA